MALRAMLLLAVLAALLPSDSRSRSVRVDTEGSGWTVVPTTILTQLPEGLGFPNDLKINPLGTGRGVTVAGLSGALAPTTVRSGFNVVNGNAVPVVLAVESDRSGVAYDAQAPLWLVPPAGYVCAANPMLSFYACPTNLVPGIKIEWGSPALEQITFLNLGSPKGIQLYDSNDFNCNPQGLTNLGTACHYDNVGIADDAWELEFNCGAGGCTQGAALQWHGTLYTATAAVLTTPSPTSPDQGPALNEFVYNDSSGLHAPPGWQAFTVTATVLLGPQCQFVAGATLTFYAVVAAYELKGVPSGTVALLDGSTTLATGTLNSLGVAKFTTSLGSGSHSLTVAYPGSSKFAPSQSAADVLTSQDALPHGACAND
jgi:hypothetical protein